MKKEETNRGFSILRFVDRYGEKCSLQESSLANESCIWLGIDNVTIKEEGWHPLYPARVRELPEEQCANLSTFGRMHLTREQVAELLPHLQRFVETGEL